MAAGSENQEFCCSGLQSGDAACGCELSDPAIFSVTLGKYSKCMPIEGLVSAEGMEN